MGWVLEGEGYVLDLCPVPLFLYCFVVLGEGGVGPGEGWVPEEVRGEEGCW